MYQMLKFIEIQWVRASRAGLNMIRLHSFYPWQDNRADKTIALTLSLSAKRMRPWNGSSSRCSMFLCQACIPGICSARIYWGESDPGLSGHSCRNTNPKSLGNVKIWHLALVLSHQAKTMKKRPKMVSSGDSLKEWNSLTDGDDVGLVDRLQMP